jgi:hypothetical protein
MSIEDKITNIENEVDAFIGKQSLFDCPGNLMILNLLRYLEFVTFLDEEKETKSNWINFGGHARPHFISLVKANSLQSCRDIFPLLTCSLALVYSSLEIIGSWVS